jgi:O-antigen/teichoic acid export membrane protein
LFCRLFSRALTHDSFRPQRVGNAGANFFDVPMMRHYLRRAADSTLARNAGWLFAGQGLSLVIQGVYFVVLARLLGSVQYGILAAAFALVSMISQYSAMGSGLLFLRYVSSDSSRFAEYWGNILVSIAVFGAPLILALRLSGPWLVGNPSASIVVFIAIADCICGQLASCISQVFQAFEKMRITATFGLLTNLLRLLLAVGMLLLLHHATARAWAIASLTISLIAAITGFVTVTIQYGWPRFVPRLFLKRMGEGFIFAVSGSTTSAYNDLDKVMLGHYGMSVANGIYSMAYRVINICTMPIMAIYGAALPRFFREGARGVQYTEPFARRLLKRTSLLGIAGAVVMFTTAPLIPYVVGRDFLSSVAALRWLCLIPLFRCLHVSAGDAMSGAGYQKCRLASQFIAAGSNFGMNLYLIPHYSWLGAAWASLITDGGLAAMNWTVLLWLKRNQIARAPLMDAA